MPITLTLYRGEKNEWWPSPEYRLMYGMTLYKPWRPSSVNDLWTRLRNEVRRQPGGTVEKRAAAYAQYLRASGHPFALATAQTGIGSFTSDYNYVITIPDAYLFSWEGSPDAPDIGESVDLDNVTADFIVLDARTIADSTILGFGHKTKTKEVTFFHDLPLDLITSCNDKPITSWKIKKWDDLSYEQKVRYGKLQRP